MDDEPNYELTKHKWPWYFTAAVVVPFYILLIFAMRFPSLAVLLIMLGVAWVSIGAYACKAMTRS